MSEENKIDTGAITWTDLTIPNAEEVKSFYENVVGWKAAPISMGDYEDYSMTSSDGEIPYAGICHTRGVNAHLPPQWLIYITVENVDASAKKCEELGSKIISEPKDMGNYGRFCVIEDPAGAVAALFTPKES